MNPDAPLDGLAGRVGAALRARGALLATAESCTGGWVAQCVTSVAGSSDWYERGWVTYSNESKAELLGVRGARHSTPPSISSMSAASERASPG